MSFYPKKVGDRSKAARMAGRVEHESAVGVNASLECGSFTSISLSIDPELGRIDEARFRSNGCGFMVAAADVLCERLAGRTLRDLHGLQEDDLARLVATTLEDFPAARRQCVRVVAEAVRTTFAAYRQSRIEEFQGEKALVCTCFGVSEETIADAIAANGLDDVDDVARVCRAGSGCGSCRMLIQELIDSEMVSKP
jgi:NifU-like protein